MRALPRIPAEIRQGEVTVALAPSLGRALFLQRQAALGAHPADRERGRLLRALRRVRGLQVPLLQRPQGLPVLVSRRLQPGPRAGAGAVLRTPGLGAVLMWGRSDREGRTEANDRK